MINTRHHRGFHCNPFTLRRGCIYQGTFTQHLPSLQTGRRTGKTSHSERHCSFTSPSPVLRRSNASDTFPPHVLLVPVLRRSNASDTIPPHVLLVAFVRLVSLFPAVVASDGHGGFRISGSVAFALHVPHFSAVVTGDAPTLRIIISLPWFVAFSRYVSFFSAVVAGKQRASWLASRLWAISGHVTRLVAVIAHAAVPRGG